MAGATVDIALMGALKTKMGWLGDRQKLVAANVANASTPGYKPKDLKNTSFDELLKGATEKNGIGVVSLMTTQVSHIKVDAPKPMPNAVESPDSETTMDGNAVVLEEQMVKMAESRLKFEAAVAFYNKSMGLLRLAGRKPS